ncbi:hypothetical protein NM04_14820 [Massilia aurea]|uniref:DUF2357 domain-containing protein n=1 Tax=Massilia aurea TaxID=373040 RepID=A0A422QJ56_9BURK|nr:DUF2357 domain-containing protein [Massilia aurea]RNF30015.1 hypothetical protein NM04_14820 [Massilia aurea]
MSYVPMHRIRFDVGAGCWIDIETALGESAPLLESINVEGILAAEGEAQIAQLLSGDIPPMCWRDAGHLFEMFQLREDTDYYIDVLAPYPLDEARSIASATPGWPFSARLSNAYAPDPQRRWREVDGKTLITGQIRLRSQAGVLDLSPVFGGKLRAEVACRKLRYFEEFKELLDSLADKAAELLLSFDSPVSLTFESTQELAANEAALHFLMRHVMAPSQLPASLEEVYANPHAQMRERIEHAPLDEIEEADPELVADGFDFSDVGRGGPLARLFNGYTPNLLPVRHSFESLDTPENRYAKAFLEHCSLLARRIESSMLARRRQASAREARAWSTSLDDTLHHAMWREVGPLTQIPANSQALLGKRGYKDLFRYDILLRMSLGLSWPQGAELSDGLMGDIRPVNQIYEYWCFFVLREILLDLCLETRGGNFLSVSADGLRVQLAKGVSSECRFEFTAASGHKARVSLFYNRRFTRPKMPKSSWEGSYTSSFDPDFSVRISPMTESVAHWLHFDAKYRLQRQQTEELFESAEQEGAARGDYQEEINRIHKQEDLYKMHTYRDGILGSRGAYVLFPGDGTGGVSTNPKPNFFVRHPSAHGGGAAHIVPSVGTFAIAPAGDSAQRDAIRMLLLSALNAATDGKTYAEETAFF